MILISSLFKHHSARPCKLVLTRGRTAYYIFIAFPNTAVLYIADDSFPTLYDILDNEEDCYNFIPDQYDVRGSDNSVVDNSGNDNGE